MEDNIKEDVGRIRCEESNAVSWLGSGYSGGLLQTQ
jgi:hypothetical protein